MRGWVLVATLVAACDGSSAVRADAEIDGKPPRVVPVLPMNIVVMRGAVHVYMDGLDLGAPDACIPQGFPAIGQCIVPGDFMPCEILDASESCITDMGVELDGQRLTMKPGYQSLDPRVLAYDPFGPGKLELVVAGCGHPPTRIPLDGDPFLNVEVNAVVENGDARVTWTTDRAATSALVSLSALGPGGYEVCHVEGVNEHLFMHTYMPHGAGVRAVGNRTEVVTDFGPATVWRAGTGSFGF